LGKGVSDSGGRGRKKVSGRNMPQEGVVVHLKDGEQDCSKNVHSPDSGVGREKKPNKMKLKRGSPKEVEGGRPGVMTY